VGCDQPETHERGVYGLREYENRNIPLVKIEHSVAIEAGFIKGGQVFGLVIRGDLELVIFHNVDFAGKVLFQTN